TIYTLQFSRYVPLNQHFFSDIGLGLTLWEGEFENTASKSWLRWSNEQGQIIPTGIERADRLAARLRELGIDPD
ncbi:MAG: hypothetical protein FD167_3741, partial [bacterium]